MQPSGAKLGKSQEYCVIWRQKNHSSTAYAFLLDTLVAYLLELCLTHINIIQAIVILRSIEVVILFSLFQIKRKNFPRNLRQKLRGSKEVWAMHLLLFGNTNFMQDTVWSLWSVMTNLYTPLALANGSSLASIPQLKNQVVTRWVWINNHWRKWSLIQAPIFGTLFLNFLTMFARVCSTDCGRGLSTWRGNWEGIRKTTRSQRNLCLCSRCSNHSQLMLTHTKSGGWWTRNHELIEVQTKLARENFDVKFEHSRRNYWFS